MDFNGQRYFDIRHNDEVYLPLMPLREKALPSDSMKRPDSTTLEEGDADNA